MSSAPKFVFECLETSCPDRKCCNRSPVMVYFEDLRRWITDQTINVVFPNLELTMDKNYPVITLKKYPNETLCAMFNKETKNCNIYYSKPISCSTFPLGFNGNAFYVMNKECPGLGKGKMTKESLKEMRNQAKLDFECRTRTTAVLPIIQGLVLQPFIKQSQEAMQKLSEEDRKKIEEIFQKEEAKAEASAADNEGQTSEPESKSKEEKSSEIKDEQ
ncbi:MAG: YkgJ family cysteine cluster protein [Candidatus Helarchaeota archaeon]